MDMPALERAKAHPARAPAMPVQVHVVDDDASIRTALVRLLGSEGYEVRAFDSAQAFLVQFDPQARGCVLLDVAMPVLDGPAVQERLIERGSAMPVIFLTGRADVETSVRVMKRGAFDLLVKPVDECELFAAIEHALERDEALSRDRAARAETESCLSTLTVREHQVLTHVIDGRLNKQIAALLGTAEKTVKVHRGRVMEKMRVRSVAELVRLLERSRPRTPDPGA